jgi:hypothetical protein
MSDFDHSDIEMLDVMTGLQMGKGRQFHLCRAAAQALVECLITTLIHKHPANDVNKRSTVPPTMFIPWIPLKVK